MMIDEIYSKIEGPVKTSGSAERRRPKKEKDE